MQASPPPEGRLADLGQKSCGAEDGAVTAGLPAGEDQDDTGPVRSRFGNTSRIYDTGISEYLEGI